MADLANIAAATTAGYKENVSVKTDGRYAVTLEKTVPDVPGHDITTVRSHGEGSSQANAESVALAALNTQRDDRQRKVGGTVDTK